MMTKLNHPGETPDARRARRYAQSRQWAKENPDKTRTYGRTHYQKNTEKRRADSLNYYYTHKAERAAYARAYYQRKKAENPAYFAQQNARKRQKEQRQRELRQQAAASCPLPVPARAPRLYVRSYAAMVRDCRRTLTLYAFAAMARDRAACGSRVDAYFAKFPFETCAEPAILRRLAQCGIRRNQAEYADCYDAGMLAYLYAIHRCAALACDYTIPYLMKMIRIYIVCARIVYRDAHNLCRINGLRELRLDAEGMQRTH